MSILQPTYYTRHPDETYSVADPQPNIQPVKQEPVAWWNGKETAWFEHELCGWQAPDGCTIPLYAAPVSAKREWVDLTDGEIHELVLTWEANALVRAVIAAFKEKNK